MTRKKFIGGVLAAGVAPTVVPSSVFGANAPSNRITLGGIGVGGVGNWQLPMAQEAGFEIVALCDVDSKYAQKARDKFPQARFYRAFRKMLADEGDRIDAVYCGTPDHTHAVISLAALAAKKHLCCVKPLTRSVEECRAVVATARRAGVATQVTAAAWTEEGNMRSMEIINAGLIGEVEAVDMWSLRPVWPQGMPAYPDFTDKVPDTLDWDLWLGPAKKRDFAVRWPKGSPIPEMSKANWCGDAVYHPFNFRGWFEFGAGALGDMGCHRANPVYKVLGLDWPEYVEASCTRVSSVAFPVASVVTFDYAKRGSRPPIRLMWHDGGILPAKPKAMGVEPLPEEGIMYHGTKGDMLVAFVKGVSQEPRVFGPGAADAAKLPRTLPRRKGGIYGEWLEACKGGEKASCNFDFAQYITEFVQLGNLAIRTGKGVKFDPVAMKVKDNDAANELLRIPYENGWTLSECKM
ncbi:MAG: Gfo/Idh/MocA family oxidoreductase [Kiritimatiellae bacterium]|nr:Gfo/Idh/MocA family oxidoreductase [Kiritimatiellia bacterium]MBQ3341048.1 Gfo/Idh/MocA family oxidoreductase [Kiritimatiellia bacterium]